jgi:hypothetical protein
VVNYTLLGGALLGAVAVGLVFERTYVAPVGAQVWIEERDAGTDAAMQGIAEVMIRRAWRKGSTPLGVVSGRVKDPYTGPMTAWGGYREALDKGEAFYRQNQRFSGRAWRAATKAALAVAGRSGEVAPRSLWYRHAVPGGLPTEWGGARLTVTLPAPNGKVLGFYEPKA